MISLRIKDTKVFMSQLLIKDTFDRMLLSEATIKTACSYTINGQINKEYYSDEEWDNLNNNEKSYSDRSFTTDKNGEIFIEGLRIGEYTVSEVGDSVSAGYVLPADKKASVKVGSTTVVEMHNVLRDTPKTGDNSKVGLWTVLAGLSALGIAGTVFAALRKKKKEDDE